MQWMWSTIRYFPSVIGRLCNVSRKNYSRADKLRRVTAGTSLASLNWELVKERALDNGKTALENQVTLEHCNITQHPCVCTEGMGLTVLGYLPAGHISGPCQASPKSTSLAPVHPIRLLLWPRDWLVYPSEGGVRYHAHWGTYALIVGYTRRIYPVLGSPLIGLTFSSLGCLSSDHSQTSFRKAFMDWSL